MTTHQKVDENNAKVAMQIDMGSGELLVDMVKSGEASNQSTRSENSRAIEATSTHRPHEDWGEQDRS